MRDFSSFLVLGFLLFPLLGSPAFSASLSVEEYLKQVREGHQGIQALKETSEGALSRSEEGDLLTSPALFANLQWASDSKPTANPAFQGTRTVFDSYSFGVSQQTSFGLGAKLYYGLTFTELDGTNIAFVPQPKFYDAHPTLELSQSILKNGFGRETRATSTLAQSAALASHYADTFKIKMALAGAEGAYWRLAIARQLVQVQKDSLDRAKRLKDWSSRRVKLQLADLSDDLQAEAGLQMRQLEYQAALDDERAAALEFNNLRGQKSDEVKDELPVLDRKTTENLAEVSKKSSREDVRAAEELSKVADSNAQLGYEKNLPILDVYGSVALNGRDLDRGEAISKSFKSESPTYALGVKFQMPLDFGQTSSDREGYTKEKAGAELNYRRKLFEEEQDWQNLNKKYLEAKARLKLAFSLEDAQAKKLDRERERLKRGRSVTYQVLQFEQDYASTQLLRLKTQGEVLGLTTQLKTFGDKP